MTASDATQYVEHAEFAIPHESLASREAIRPVAEASFAWDEPATHALEISEYLGLPMEVAAPGSTGIPANSTADTEVEAKAKANRRKRLKQLNGYTTTAAVVAVTCLDDDGKPVTYGALRATPGAPFRVRIMG